MAASVLLAVGVTWHVYNDGRRQLKEAIAHSRGEISLRTYEYEVPGPVDVKAIRGKSGLSQSQFARRYGFTAMSARQWAS